MKRKFLLIITTLLVFISQANAQLQKGDIVVLGISADAGAASPNNKSEFSWVTLVNIPATTKIYFTDAGWNMASNDYMSSGDLGEILIRYTAPGLINAGTVFTVSEAGLSGDYAVISGTKFGSDSALSLPNAGDQILVFQSTDTEGPSFGNSNFSPIFMATTHTTNFASMISTIAGITNVAFKDNWTNLVPGLTQGTNAIAAGIGPGESDESDNSRYVGITSGSRATLLAAVSSLSNWRRYDDTPITAGLAHEFADFNGINPTGWTANGATSFTVLGSDITPPAVSSIVLSGSPAGNSTSISFVVTFNEAAQNISTGDFTLNKTLTANGTISSVSASSGTSVTVTVTGITGTGNMRLDLNSNTDITDATGNGNNNNGFVGAFTSGSVQSVDTNSPTVSITSSASNPTNSSLIAVTITFSESVTGFAIGDLSINSNGSLSGLSGSGANYSVNITPTADGTITLNIGAGAAQDAGTNNSVAASQFSIVSDRTSPTVSMSSVSTSPTKASPIVLNITFSESVVNFAQGDIVVSGGTTSGFSGSGANYSVNITPSASGTITANIAAGIANDTALNNNIVATQFSIVSDITTPTVSITSGQSSPTNANPININITFSESVLNFVQGDVVVTGGTLTSLLGSGASYFGTITPSGNGTITVNIAAGVANDIALNNNTVATQFSIVSDTTAPTVSISSGLSSPTNAATIPVTITFSESVINFVQADIQVTNGSLSGFSGSGTTYTVNIAPSDGTVTVNINAGVANDAALNNNSAATQFSIVSDRTSPTVSITSGQSNPTNANPININITFSESVSNFVSGDVTVAGGTLTSLLGSGASYFGTITPSGNGTITVNIAAGVANDAASNGNTAATQFSIVSDTTTPTVSISSGLSSPTNAATIPVTITFSESVINFVVGDIQVTNGSLSGFSGSGTTYTVNITPSNGTVTVNIAQGVANDAATNGNSAATQFSIVSDAVPPTVSITSAQTSPTNASIISLTITFNEAVTGFTLGDMTAGNGILSNFSGSGAVYTASLTPSSNGTVTVDIGAGVVNDAASNINSAATQFSIISDTTAPGLTITSTLTSPTNAATIPITFTFTEAVTGFISSDVFVTGATLSGFSGSGSVYTATLTPPSNGTVTVFVFQNVLTDLTGNPNAFISFSIDSDKTRPTVVISSSASSPTSTAPIPLIITFSEPVTNFIVTDITATGGSLSGFAGSGADYTVNLTPSGTGNKNINIAAGTSVDLANNINFAATQFSIVYITPCSLTTTWNGLFWTNGDPVATQPAVFTADYSSFQDISACSLIIGNNANVTFNSGTNLTISGNITVQAGSSLTFESDSNLIQSGTVNNNSGNITYKRQTSMRRLDYTYWSSPVAGQNLKAFSPMTVSPPIAASRFYRLDEPTNTFVALDPLVTSFTAAKGYMVRAPNDFTTDPAPWTGQFTGVPNNGNISTPVTVTNALGFNMIGNPYPSTINADLFLASNPGTLYFWTHSVQGSQSNNYSTYNGLGGTGSASGGAIPNGFIQAGQGFIIQKSTAGNAVFTNAMRVINSDGQFFRTANDPDKHRLWLNLSAPDGLLNQILIGYMAGATQGADESIDGKLLGGGTTISSIINNENYVIQGRALPFTATDVVPLNFTALTAGTYTLSIDHTDGLFAEQDIFLQDYLTGVVSDIKQSAYTFASAEGTFANRFAIVYINSTLAVTNPLLDANDFIVYKNNNMLNINSASINMKAVRLFDIRGRLIFEKDGINSKTLTINDLNAEQQVLLVQIKAEDNKTITKKVVY